jgi:hypothetical protein
LEDQHPVGDWSLSERVQDLFLLQHLEAVLMKQEEHQAVVEEGLHQQWKLKMDYFAKLALVEFAKLLVLEETVVR